MLTGKIRSQVDAIWHACWSSGIFNRMEVILKGSTATPDQIEFIELIVQELTLNGVMEANRLFQSPFTCINSQGPLKVFPLARVSTLVNELRDVRPRAVA